MYLCHKCAHIYVEREHKCSKLLTVGEGYTVFVILFFPLLYRFEIFQNTKLGN